MGIRRQPVDIERLRKAAPFPSFSASFQLGFSTNEILLGESELWPGQIAQLRSRLKTNPAATKERFRLAQLLNASEQDAARELTRVISETENALRKTPRNAELLLQLGESLDMQKEHIKAEDALRRATALAPKDWRMQVALGQALNNQMLKLFSRESDNSLSEIQQTALSGNKEAAIAALKRFFKDQGSTKKLDLLRQRGKAIGDCYSRAVALAPKHPVPKMHQLSHRFFGSEEFWKTAPNQESANTAEATRWMIERTCSPEQIAALKQAIPYQSQSPKLIATVAFTEFVLGMLLLTPAQAESANPAEHLPAKTKETLQQSIRTIRGFLSSPDIDLRKRALQSLAALYYLQQDMGQAEKQIQAARKLGALSENSIDLMTIVYTQSSQTDKAEVFFNEILSKTPNLKSYQRLACMQFERGGLTEGKKTVAAALKHYPMDSFSHLMGLTCAIRENQSSQIKESLAELSRHNLETDYLDHLLLLRGFIHAIEGRVAEARTIFERFPDDDAAKEALTALGV